LGRRFVRPHVGRKLRGLAKCAENGYPSLRRTGVRAGF